MTGMGKAQRLRGEQVSADFFHLLGMKPVTGRSFSKQDDTKGAAPVVMLSGRFWKNKFAGSPNVLGRALNLDGTGTRLSASCPRTFIFAVNR